jgi:hypothetical protein
MTSGIASCDPVVGAATTYDARREGAVEGPFQDSR